MCGELLSSGFREGEGGEREEEEEGGEEVEEGGEEEEEGGEWIKREDSKLRVDLNLYKFSRIKLEYIFDLIIIDHL